MGFELSDGNLQAIRALARSLPDDLSADRLAELEASGQLVTLLSALPNTALCDDLSGVVGGEYYTANYGHIIRSFVSDGRTGRDWIDYFDGRISEGAKQFLRSGAFESTKGRKYHLRLAPGRYSSDRFYTPNRVTFADGAKAQMAEIEFGCLLRENFTDAEMESLGLGKYTDPHSGIMIIHNPIACEQKRTQQRYLVAKYNYREDLVAYPASGSLHGYLYAYCVGIEE